MSGGLVRFRIMIDPCDGSAAILSLAKSVPKVTGQGLVIKIPPYLGSDGPPGHPGFALTGTVCLLEAINSLYKLFKPFWRLSLRKFMLYDS
jgi:hypothetical protein